MFARLRNFLNRRKIKTIREKIVAAITKSQNGKTVEDYQEAWDMLKAVHDDAMEFQTTAEQWELARACIQMRLAVFEMNLMRKHWQSKREILMRFTLTPDEKRPKL